MSTASTTGDQGHWYRHLCRRLTRPWLFAVPGVAFLVGLMSWLAWARGYPDLRDMLTVLTFVLLVAALGVVLVVKRRDISDDDGAALALGQQNEQQLHLSGPDVWPYLREQAAHATRLRQTWLRGLAGIIIVFAAVCITAPSLTFPGLSLALPLVSGCFVGIIASLERQRADLILTMTFPPPAGNQARPAEEGAAEPGAASSDA